jgi:hypothetical protein
VNPPLLLLVGGTKLKGAFPNVFAVTEKFDRTVVAGLTVRVTVAVPDT